MMSISPLRSTAGAAEYYLKEEKDLNQSNLSLEQDNNDNYYLKEKSAEPNSFWHGKLAEEAGLLGKPVEQAALESVLSGNLGEETIKGKRDDHKSGLDLTLSAPKGLSILALVGGDTRLQDILKDAVKFVADEIEKDTAQVTSINKEGEREYHNTGNMIFAAIGHKTSRENDMQLHYHVLTPNMTRDQEGQLRTLASSIKQKGGVISGTSERIYNFQKYYTALFHSKIAHDVEAIGYQTHGLGNGQIDISGVPQPLIEANSTRKQQIDQQALNFGDTQAAKDTAALDTRKAKSYESDAALNAKWQQQTKNAGFTPETLVQQAQQVAKSSHNPEHIAKDAFERAVEHLGQHSTVLHLEKVIELATSDFTKGGVQANAIDLKAVADQWIKEGALVPLAKKGQYTTQAMLDTEQHLMTVTQGRAHHMRTPVSRRTLNTLDIHQDQQQKVADIYQSTKQFHVVNVHGSNASIAQSLLNVGNHAGKRVHLVSQHTKDKQRHDQQVQRESRTFATWVKHHFTPEQRHTRFGLLQEDTPLTNKDILLIDDAQTLSADELIALTEKAQQSNSKVVMLNRVSSRQGFKANNAIELYRKGNVMSHSWANQTSKDTQVSLHAQDTQALAKAYTYLTDKDNTQVIATSGVEQRRLSDAIRASMQNAGQLARTGVTLFTQQPHYLSKPQQSLAQHYKAGMTLRHWKDGKPHDVVVASTDRQDNLIHVLSKTDGSAMTFNPSSQDFKALNMQVFKPEALTIVQGERLLTTGKHFPARLDANSRYTVTDIGKHGITLKDAQGEQQTLPLDAFKDAPLQYDYVQSANQLREAQRTLVSGKAFTLSKALFHDVTEKTERIDVFTDQPDKAQRALEKSDVKPSAIERVTHTHTTTDRYLSEATALTLRSDIKLALTTLTQEQHTPLIEKAVSFALNHLSEREAAFSQKALVVEAVRYAFEEAGGAITKTQIETELAKRSDTLSAEYSDGTRWTTQAALDTEKRILQTITDGKDQHQPFATPKQIQTFLDTQPRLTQGQKDAITLISTSKDTFVAVQGLAGTGKSTILESNIELIQHTCAATGNAPSQVIGLAPTHAAVAELENKGVKAQTLESLLSDLRQGQRHPSDYQNTLFFLDESSMVGNQQVKEFTALVSASQSKATFLGDTEQLLSLSAGNPFGLAIHQGRIETAYMTDIVRQQNATLLGAVHNILDKQPESALDKLKQQAPDTLGSTLHVVSTLDEHAKDKARAQLAATEALPYTVAKEYLSLTPETRENALMILYTNQERDQTTDYVRVGLMKNNELGKENIMTTRLRSTGHSVEELSTMMPYQKGLFLSTRPGEYGEITHIDSEHGVVMVKNAETGIEKAFLPRNKDHKFTTLLSKSEKPLSTGDNIMTRFTDKECGIKANVEYRITQASHDGIIAKTDAGQTLTIRPNELKDGHWDYAYTRTANMSQGTTRPIIIAGVKSKAALTDLRHAYIDNSRASQHVKLITDNPTRLVKTWLSKESHKASAIETIGTIPPKETTYFNTNALPHEDVRFQNKSGDFDYDKFKEHINTQLPKYTESLAVALLGQPNKSKSDRDYLTFGVGQSAIKVTLTGEYRGYFKDYTTGEKGSLINLMMSHKEISYKDAINEAHKMLNEPNKYQLEENNKHDKLLATTPRHIAQFEERAKEYVEQSLPIDGTLAQRYLNHLGVNNIENSHVKYHPAVYSSEDKSFHPAMLTNIHNKQGETKAIEVTFLDGEGNKDNTLDINPRTLGTKSKNMTQFHQGTDLNTTIISTSVEQSFLINDALQGQYDIINVNHKNDIQNLPRDELRQHIVVALSHGNTDLNPNNVEKIVANFSGKELQFVFPEHLLRDIESSIDKFERREQSQKHGLEWFEKQEEKSLIPSHQDLSQYRQERDSRALEQFEPHEKLRQPELDLEPKSNEIIDREIERELER